MEKFPVTNNTASPIYVGADMIPAGETRHFFLDQIPEHLRPAPAAAVKEEPKDELAELSTGTAKDIIAALPGLTAEDLTRLEEMESARMTGDKPSARKSVLAAVQEEQLRRAEAATGGDRPARDAGTPPRAGGE